MTALPDRCALCVVDGCGRPAVQRGARCRQHYRQGDSHVIRHYADRTRSLSEGALAYALADTDEQARQGWDALEHAARRWASEDARARIAELESRAAALESMLRDRTGCDRTG